MGKKHALRKGFFQEYSLRYNINNRLPFGLSYKYQFDNKLVLLVDLAILLENQIIYG